jgi:hypothetical protein
MTQNFYFALEFPVESARTSLLADVAEHVFKHVGCSSEHVGGLSRAVDRASGGEARERCDVRFHAREGELEVLVSADGDRVWQTSILLR